MKLGERAIKILLVVGALAGAFVGYWAQNEVISYCCYLPLGVEIVLWLMPFSFATLGALLVAIPLTLLWGD